MLLQLFTIIYTNNHFVLGYLGMSWFTNKVFISYNIYNSHYSRIDEILTEI